MQEAEVRNNGKKLLRFEIRFLLNRAAIDIAFHPFFLFLNSLRYFSVLG